LALGYVLMSFVPDAVISFILLGLFRKPYEQILARVKNRWVASGITTFIVVVVLLLPLFGFFYALTIEAAVAFEQLRFLFEEGGEGFVQSTLELAESKGLRITPQL